MSLFESLTGLLGCVQSVHDGDRVAHRRGSGLGDVLHTVNFTVGSLERLERQRDAALRVGALEAKLVVVLVSSLHLFGRVDDLCAATAGLVHDE